MGAAELPVAGLSRRTALFPLYPSGLYAKGLLPDRENPNMFSACKKRSSALPVRLFTSGSDSASKSASSSSDSAASAAGDSASDSASDSSTSNSASSSSASSGGSQRFVAVSNDEDLTHQEQLASFERERDGTMSNPPSRGDPLNGLDHQLASMETDLDRQADSSGALQMR